VAQYVIDCLELVEVQAQHRYRLAAVPLTCQGVFQTLEKLSTVR
jgi:hypothetical protein